MKTEGREENGILYVPQNILAYMKVFGYMLGQLSKVIDMCTQFSVMGISWVRILTKLNAHTSS